MKRGGSTDKPTIVFFTLSILEIGGVERNMLQIINGLKESYRFHILAPATDTFLKELQSISADISFSPLKKVSKLNLWYLVRIWKLLKSIDPVLVHSFDPRGRLMGHFVAKLQGRKTLHAYHIIPLSFPELTKSKQLTYRFMELISNKILSEKLLFVSGKDRESYLELGLVQESNSLTVYNGISSEMQQNDMANLTKEKTRKTFGFSDKKVLGIGVGRLTNQKGFDLLLRSLASLRREKYKRITECQVAIVGIGEELESLETLKSEYKLDDVVTLTGFLSHEDVVSLLEVADFFVLPSRYECFPYTILESVANGLPCIVTDVGGNKEMVTHGYNGWVIEKENIPQLCNALKEVLSDKQKREVYGLHSLERAKAFTEEAMIEKMKDLYKDMVGR